jgi:exoribonuclease II
MGESLKRTPEEIAKQLENQRRLERIIERRLAEEEAARAAKLEQQPEPDSR